MGLEIPQADDLAKVGNNAALQGIPTIVFVSRDACPYCRSLRESVLSPMYAAHKFDGRAVLIEVSLDREAPLMGFDGKEYRANSLVSIIGRKLPRHSCFLILTVVKSAKGG